MQFGEQFQGVCSLLKVDRHAFELGMAKFPSCGYHVGTHLNIHTCLRHEVAERLNRLDVLANEQDFD
jgi:hypothetical protein